MSKHVSVYIKIFIALPGLLIGFLSYAQSNSKLSVAIQLGPSFPVGKYGSKDYKDTAAGFAKTGGALSISFNYPLVNKISATLLIGGSMNKQDESSMTKRMNERMVQGTESKVSTNSWKIVKLLAGPTIQFPLSSSRKLFSSSKLLAGIAKTSIPEYRGITYYNNTPNGNFWFGKISLSWTFCYQISTGFNMQINKRMFFLTEVNFFNSAPVHHTLKNINFPNPAGPYVPVDNKYSLASVNIIAGVSLSF